jgi:hypothetical protein
MEIATWAPDTTYRALNTFHRAVRRVVEYEPPTQTPGPRPGSRHRIPPTQKDFDDYVRKRANAGVSTQMLASDAEANRLYRRWRGDMAASLSDKTVRRAIERARKRAAENP